MLGAGCNPAQKPFSSASWSCPPWAHAPGLIQSSGQSEWQTGSQTLKFPVTLSSTSARPPSTYAPLAPPISRRMWAAAGYPSLAQPRPEAGALGLRTANARTGLPGSWDTGALHHPDPSTATQGPRSPIVLVGGALRGPLGWGAFGGPLPLGAFAQPLEHGGEAGTGSGWALLAGGREGDARPCWLLAGLWRGGAAVGGWQFLGGPSLQVWCLGQARPAHAPAPPARPPRRARPAPAQPVWEERAQPRGGAPARLPRRFGLVRPTRPAKEQRSHPGGEVAGARLNRPT